MYKMFPFQVPQAVDMKPMDKVACMVWLSTHKTLKELRLRQSYIEQQFTVARKENKPERTFANLGVMQDYTSAAVAHQSFPDEYFWMAFI